MHDGALVSGVGSSLPQDVHAVTYRGQPVNAVIDHITDVDTEQSGALPTEFALSQNYPNPFNPVTTIEFSLPVASDVVIVVYNVAGQVVKTLANNVISAGYHSIEWNSTDESGNSVASGIYLYRLTADGFVQSRKMLLLK